MLNIITRATQSAKEFIEIHNLNKDECRIVRNVSELIDVYEEDYVIVPPLPLFYQYAMRPLFKLNKMTNKTKYYNNKLIKF